MRWSFVALMAMSMTPSLAADQMLFWNETAHEMTGVYLAPVGTENFGPNQALNDDDKSVGADERLVLTGLKAGHYDVKLVDTKGRTCMVHDVEVRAGGKVAFSINEKQLTSCK
jgi:hypothetical protein